MRLPALLLGALLAAGGLTTGCAAGGAGGGCRPASAAPAVQSAPRPPKPKKTADRKPVCTPATSEVWKSFKPYRGNIKTNGERGSKRRFYQWDYSHGDIEVYDGDGWHLGSMDPESKKMTKPPVKGRQLRGIK